MKYKLINKQTKEEHLCDKVTIDGFNYYVSDESVRKEDGWCWDSRYKKLVTPEQNLKTSTHDADFYCKIIATNNPNTDVPKVVDEVEELAAKSYTNKFTSYKVRKQGFKTGYNKSQETHPFSEEDMIEFDEWVDNMGYTQVANGLYKSLSYEKGKITKELLQLWKKQRIKTIYYS